MVKSFSSTLLAATLAVVYYSPASSAASSHAYKVSTVRQKQQESKSAEVKWDSHHEDARSLRREEQDGDESSICNTCSFPNVYTFRLAFNNHENCTTSTLRPTESNGMKSVHCQIKSMEVPTKLPLMLPTPNYISSILFFEFDTSGYLNVIHENTTYLNNALLYNNEIFTFPSLIAAEGYDNEHGMLPGGAGLFLFGSDEYGDPILRSEVVWEFPLTDSELCKNTAAALEVESLGWIIFENVESINHEICAGSSSYPFSSPSIMSSPPTLSPAPSNILAPTIITESSVSPVIGVGTKGSKSSKSVQKSKSSKQAKTKNDISHR